MTTSIGEYLIEGDLAKPGRYGGVTHIDYDPIPADYDRVNII